MITNLIPEKELFAELRDRGFIPTDYIDAELRVWSYNGKPHIIPQPRAENSEQGFYLKDDIDKFFQNALLDAAIDDPCDERMYNVERIRPLKAH